jgi:glycosyltransferase involved in cell wall biosynthesis
VRVAAWTPEPKGVTPGQRFRIEQWEAILRSHGLDLVYHPFLDSRTAALLKSSGRSPAKAVRLLQLLLQRVRLAASIDCDLVFVFRESALLGPAIAERILKRRAIPYVYDFDDSVWIRYRSPANSFWSYLRCPGKTATSCRLAAHVLAGNETLAGYARAHGRLVSVVPTTIDTDLYRPTAARGQGMIVIGWSGSYSTGPYLELVRPVLQRLARRFSFRIVTIGAREFRVDGVEVDVRPWRAESEVSDINQFDIGIMPLPDARWEQGKCGLKALQYMALSIPTVASPVGVNRDIIAHGENGLLAATQEEWEAALGRLVADAALRRTLGRAGRDTVERSYSARVHAPRVAALLCEVVALSGKRQAGADRTGRSTTARTHRFRT